MSCEYMQELISLSIDGESTEKEEIELNKHLKECEDCRDELELQKAIQVALKETTAYSLPEDFHSNIMNTIEKISIEEKRPIFKFTYFNKVAVILLFVMITFLGIKEIIPINQKELAMNKVATTQVEEANRAMEINEDADLSVIVEENSNKSIGDDFKEETFSSEPVADMESQLDESILVTGDKLKEITPAVANQLSEPSTELDIQDDGNEAVIYEETEEPEIKQSSKEVDKKNQLKDNEKKDGRLYVIGLAFLTLLIVLLVKLRK